jgi:acyl-CoA thioesterase-2
MSEPRAPRESLSEMLRVEPAGGARFRARLESFWGAAAPGDLLARAVLAAGARRDAPASVHAIFLREAKPDVELTLDCEELSAECTRVTVFEREERVAELRLRFARPGEGLTYQSVAPARGLPAPEELPSEAELGAREGWGQYAAGPIEARRVTPPAPVKDHERATWVGWLRPRAPLADDALLHAAALAFAAEYRSHWAVERRLGADFPRTEITLLDYTLWIHRALPWHDWWLVKTESDVGVGGRCLSRREIFARDGALIASAAWQAALRILPTGAH